MADLVAQGKKAHDQWRRTLPDGEIMLGRDADHCAWPVPWDLKISRAHASIAWGDGKLTVRRIPAARNPVYFDGKPVDEFCVLVGQRFAIGDTIFTLHEGEPTPVSEMTCNAQDLLRERYADAGERLEALAELPALIRHSPSDQELENRVIDVLLKGIPRSESAALVHLPPSPAGEPSEIRVCATKGRGSTPPTPPSRRLVVEAIRGRQNLLHTWDMGKNEAYTVPAGCDWAICVPLLDDSSLGLYVSGRILELRLQNNSTARTDLLRSDMRFTCLTAEVFAALRQLSFLQRRQSQLSGFFPPSVMAVLQAGDMEEALKPREADVTVLFCDLRGSCQVAEQGAADLPALWLRISAALDIMASSIADQEGVVGDFQGDGAMGFWGWPIECEDRAQRAARAALNIRRRFAQVSKRSGHPLYGFDCGIGLASGRAIAGRLGTPDLFKVDIFGPVVNLAARLEGMTKIFATPIVVDEDTYELLTKSAPKNVLRCRQLARVQPYGMRRSLLVTELLPPPAELGAMSEPDRRDYEAALRNFMEGRWSGTRDLLMRLPNDKAGHLLLDFMDRHTSGPPTDWQGVIPLPK
jgi:adenylate cyclase